MAAAAEATRKWAALASEGWAKAAKIAGGWEQESVFQCGYVPIEVWRSRHGVHVYIAQVEGPLVNSYVVVPTECLSDNGLPHTLEHLVFLGSEDYPYKGVLDKVAFRNLATGTNAYTDVHHTAYTLTTAGKEGTLALLPVFLDHVLYPTITPSGFVTEVYHVDGEGADAGVVFSEMQAIENESGSVAYLALRKLLYPNKCGYAMETGGMMHDIRSLTVEQIRQYHFDYYRPDNTFVIVTGMVGAHEVLDAVDKLAPKLSAPHRHPPLGSLPRPFSEHPVAPLISSVSESYDFPADEEDSGCVMIGWRAHKFCDFKRTVALNLLHAYLTESEVSLLHHHFVEGGEEGEQGECGSVSCGLCENGDVFHYVSFDAVRTSAIESIQPQLLQVLRELAEEGFDMPRMATVIHRFHVRHLNSLEDAPHDTLAHYLTLSLIFGAQADDAARKLSSVFDLNSLAVFSAYSSDDWVRLLKETMLEQPMACVRAVPSAARAAHLTADQTARVAARVESLGEKGLAELQATLDAAVAANETPVPDAVLEAFQVPSVDTVSFIPLSSAVYPPCARAERTAQTQEALRLFALHLHAPDLALPPAAHATPLHDALDSLCAAALEKPAHAVGVHALQPAALLGNVSAQQQAALPLYVQLDDVASDFIELRLVLDTAPLDDLQRAYLELYLEAQYSLPVLRRIHPTPRSGPDQEQTGEQQQEVVAWDALVQELQEHLVHYGNSLGFGGGNFACGAFSQVVIMSLKSQGGAARYHKAVTLMREIACDSVFTASRLGVAANNLLNDIPDTKRQGDLMAQCGLRETVYGEGGSNHRACNLVRQQRFLTKVVARLESEPAKVIAEMQAMRAVLTGEGRMMCQVVGNVTNLAEQGCHALMPFVQCFPPSSLPLAEVMQPGRVRLTREVHSPAVASPLGQCKVLGMASMESCFLYACAPGLPSFQHADTAAMLVATELLTCIEGPMWNLIRGLGLAYSFTMYGDADEGLCYFSLSRSPALAKAYAEAGRLVKAFATGSTAITDLMLENAVASVMSSVMSRESTVAQCGMQSLMTALRRSGLGHNSRLLKSVAGVRSSQVLEVMDKYLVALFCPKTANVFCTSSPAKLDEVCAGMEEAGWQVLKPASLDELVIDTCPDIHLP